MFTKRAAPLQATARPHTFTRCAYQYRRDKEYIVSGLRYGLVCKIDKTDERKRSWFRRGAETSTRGRVRSPEVLPIKPLELRL